MADWRKKWHASSNGETQALFPFGIVQIAPVIAKDGLAATGIRWFQTGSTPGGSSSPMTASARGYLPNDLIPGSFMATTIDLGDALSPFGSVHCRYKTEVGTRLANAALKYAYDLPTVYTGPVFSYAKAESRVGDRAVIILHFNDTGVGGLQLQDMVINANHSQGNWSGETPFEVCIRPPSNATPTVTCRGAGALAAGGDLLRSNMTLPQAVTWCQQKASCAGFTAKSSAYCTVNQSQSTCCAAADDGTIRQVYFKRVGGSPNVDRSWISYVKDVQPCSVLSRYEHWFPPKHVKVVGRKTIELSGMSGKVAAVRMNWRAYPCEHLSCGVYSDGLPPPPFWAEVQ